MDRFDRKFLAAVAVCLLSAPIALAAPTQEPAPCVSYLCMVADTGLVVAESDADVPRAPASMVKMILMLLVAEGLEAGDWTLDTPITISAHAQSIGGSQVYLRAGQEYTLSELIDAVAVLSANDAATAIAEGLWGSEETYLGIANLRAAELGLSSTIVRSTHGLPPTNGNEHDQTSARDMANLARACIAKPQIMEWVGKPTLDFGSSGRERRSTNRLLYNMDDCDGLKTGYTRAAGWCFTGTAIRDGVRLITVVMGCDSVRHRFDSTEWIMEQGFARVKKVRLLAAGQEVEPPIVVENSKQSDIRLAVTEPVDAILDTQGDMQVRYVAEIPNVLRAPLPAGSVVGKLKIQAGDQVIGTAPLAVPSELEVPGWPWKVKQSVLKRAPQQPSAAPQASPLVPRRPIQAH